MRRPRRSSTGVAIAALTTGLLLGASPASAAPPTRITEPIDFTFTDDDFCGEGLSVEIVGDGEERVHVAERRGETYFSAHVRLEQTFTNTATGATFTTREVSRFRDLHVTNNGDGNADGSELRDRIVHDVRRGWPDHGKGTGQSRFETIIDLNGTPDDFDDDTVVSEELILGSTGTNDDFCEVAIDALA
jgi:hypothetical protein